MNEAWMHQVTADLSYWAIHQAN